MTIRPKTLCNAIISQQHEEILTSLESVLPLQTFNPALLRLQLHRYCSRPVSPVLIRIAAMFAYRV